MVHDIVIRNMFRQPCRYVDADEDHCSSNPCMNDAECRPLSVGFTCSPCPLNVTGARCELGIWSVDLLLITCFAYLAPSQRICFNTGRSCQTYFHYQCGSRSMGSYGPGLNILHRMAWLLSIRATGEPQNAQWVSHSMRKLPQAGSGRDLQETWNEIHETN